MSSVHYYANVGMFAWVVIHALTPKVSRAKVDWRYVQCKILCKVMLAGEQWFAQRIRIHCGFFFFLHGLLSLLRGVRHRATEIQTGK